MIDKGASLARAKQVLAGTKLVVLAGGVSSESEGSLETAEAIVPILRACCREVTQTDITDVDQLIRSVRDVDFALNVLYGRVGEDGRIQGFLDVLGIRYSGCPVLASAIGMSKEIFLSLISQWGHRTPHGLLFSELESVAAVERFKRSPSGFVVKPLDEGDSFGLFYTPSWTDVQSFAAKVPDGETGRWRVEQFVDGVHGTIAAIRLDGEIVAGDAVEFSFPDGKKVYDTELKWAPPGTVKYTTIENDLIPLIKRDAVDIYDRLHCSGFVRIDFILDKDGPVYLEMNTIPGLYPGSNVDLSFSRYFTFEETLIVGLASQIEGAAASAIERQFA